MLFTLVDLDAGVGLVVEACAEGHRLWTLKRERRVSGNDFVKLFGRLVILAIFDTSLDSNT